VTDRGGSLTGSRHLSVRAAGSPQGLGFADLVGDSVRARLRTADRRFECAAIA
jgi:hypothetical protein